MATRDRNTQHNENNVFHDYGCVTLGTDGTKTFPTPLKRLRSASACYKSGAIGATALNVSDISSGSVTITAGGGALNAGAIVWYDLMGVL